MAVDAPRTACRPRPTDAPEPGARQAALLARAMAGELPPNVALMQLIAAAENPREIDTAVATASIAHVGDAERIGRLAAIAGLWRETPDAWQTVKETLAAAAGREGRDGPVGPDASARLFDRLAAAAPDAAAALYALGRPDVLERATASVVAALGRFGLLGPDRDVLDLGCGSGRVALALAPHVRSVLGLDVSTGMLALARTRRRGLANVCFRWMDGSSLAGAGSEAFDLVVAVDAFPYVETGDGLADEAGTAAPSVGPIDRADAGAPPAGVALVGEVARVLRSNGSLVILNLSYAHDLAAQRRIACRLAAAAGLDVVRNGTRDVDWWDGLTFHMRRPGAASRGGR